VLAYITGEKTGEERRGEERRGEEERREQKRREERNGYQDQQNGYRQNMLKAAQPQWALTEPEG